MTLATAPRKTPGPAGLYRAFVSGEVKGARDATRTIEHVITSRMVDRDGDVVEPRGGRFEAYRKNPIVLFGHDHRGFPIGRNVGLTVSDHEIVAVTKFAGAEQNNAEGETAYRLVRDGFMRAWSIGFRPITMSNDKTLPDQDGIWFKEWELMEYSLVAVPSNPEALTRIAKEYGAGAWRFFADSAPEVEMLDRLIGEAFDRVSARLGPQPAPSEGTPVPAGPLRVPGYRGDLGLIPLAAELNRVRGHLRCQAAGFFTFDAGARQAYERRLDHSITDILGTVARERADRRAFVAAVQHALDHQPTIF